MCIMNIDEDRIAQRAYAIWIETGRDDAFLNWLQAEQELDIPCTNISIQRSPKAGCSLVNSPTPTS